MNRTASRHPSLLRRDSAMLVVVDPQDTLLRTIHQRDHLIKHMQLLIAAARIVGVPVIATTQNADRLGGIPEDLATSLFDAEAVLFDKMSFSCCGSQEFVHHLDGLGRNQIVVIGVETHICVAQTAMDLSTLGFQTHIAADAVSSRTFELHKLGMERIRDSGVLPCASESVLYEWAEVAGTTEFRAMLPLVKEL